MRKILLVGLLLVIALTLFTTEAFCEDDDWTNLNPASLRWFPLRSRRGGGSGDGTTFFATPEYPLGTILGLAVCLAALVIFKSRRSLKMPSRKL